MQTPNVKASFANFFSRSLLAAIPIAPNTIAARLTQGATKYSIKNIIRIIAKYDSATLLKPVANINNDTAGTTNSKFIELIITALKLSFLD